MELENTVFLIAPDSAVFSSTNHNIIYPILKYYKTLHILSCKCFDFTGHEILLIARSCVIFGQFREIPEGLMKQPTDLE